MRKKEDPTESWKDKGRLEDGWCENTPVVWNGTTCWSNKSRKKTLLDCGKDNEQGEGEEKENLLRDG